MIFDPFDESQNIPVTDHGSLGRPRGSTGKRESIAVIRFKLQMFVCYMHIFFPLRQQITIKYDIESQLQQLLFGFFVQLIISYQIF